MFREKAMILIYAQSMHGIITLYIIEIVEPLELVFMARIRLKILFP